MTQTPRIAVYPGSFDPVTNGHLDIIRRAAHLFDQLYVGVGVSPHKSCMFPTATRVNLIEQACYVLNDSWPDRVHVDKFEGLVADYAEKVGAMAIVRGLRTITDFEFEFQFAHVTRQLKPGIEIVLLPTVEENSYVSSSIVREIARHGGDLSKFVPPCVAQAVELHLASSQNFVRTNFTG